MDSLLVRSARRRRLAAMLLVLEERGGDELAVLEGVADGMVLGLDSHGALDLEALRDWSREMDQEERDRLFYGACAREADRRARANGIAARPDDPCDPNEAAQLALARDVDELRGRIERLEGAASEARVARLPDGIDGAALVAELEAARLARGGDEQEPPPRRGRRPSAGSLAELGSVLEEVAGGDGETRGTNGR